MPKNPNRKKILAGSNNAAAKWGFDSPTSAVLTQAPKTYGQYFLKFYGTDKNNADFVSYSSKVKSISEVMIQIDSQSIDRYGKRVHIPTRVEFPPVTLAMYDTIDGNTFAMARGIYDRYFKNASLADGEKGTIDATINDINSGIKTYAGNDPQVHHFTKIEIFHFFGQGEQIGSHFGAESSSAPAKIQKIVLINPLVTNITFDADDYSTSDAKTIQFQLQPENVLIKDTNVTVSSPDWLTKGMESAREVLLNGDAPKLNGASYDELSTIYTDLERLGVQTEGIGELKLLTSGDGFSRGTFTSGSAAIPSFGNLVSNTPGFGNYGGNEILDSFQNELINSVFNGTKFSMKNIGKNVLQGVLGNKGLSDIQSLKPTSTSKFGFVGDIVRDNVRNSLLNENVQSATGTVIAPTAPQPSSPAQQELQGRVVSQSEVNKIKTITNPGK